MSARIALVIAWAALAAGAAAGQTVFKCTTRKTVEYRESGCEPRSRETALRANALTGLGRVATPRTHRLARQRTRVQPGANRASAAPAPAPGAAVPTPRS